MYFAVEFRDELLKKQKLLLNLTTSPKCVVHYGTFNLPCEISIFDFYGTVI